MRCEGRRRYGGAFNLGPVTWEQCKNSTNIKVKFKDEEGIQTLPACQECIAEMKDPKWGIKIIRVITK